MSKATRSRIRRSMTLFFTLVALLCLSAGHSDISCRNSKEICARGGAPANDPWYGFVLVTENGYYHPDPDYSKAYNARHEELDPIGFSSHYGDISAATCFIRVVAVFSSGEYQCYNYSTDTWSQALCSQLGTGVCPGGDPICLTNKTDAFSGRYTVLGEIAKMFPKVINSSVNVAAETARIGNFVVVDDDWMVIGVNEENYVRDLWSQEKKSGNKDYESAQWYIIYTLARLCDIVGPINDTRICKRNMIFDRDYRNMQHLEIGEVYPTIIDKMNFQDCLWFMVDYGKFHYYPGVMIVLLNRSKFGTHKGFMFNAIVDQESQFINHIYIESLETGVYGGGVEGHTCCNVLTGNNWNYECVPVQTCVSDAACIWSTRETGGCVEAAISNCPDCTGQDTHLITQALKGWNSNAGDRLFGCDWCGEGAYTCSMGAALADYIAMVGVNVAYPTIPWPSFFNSALTSCGYYRPWIMDHWVTGGNPDEDCNCLTGWKRTFVDRIGRVNFMCTQAECEECARRGYGCQWETGSTNGCYNCRDPTPHGRPDTLIIDNSVRSIETIINASFVRENSVHWDGASFACGHNTGRGYEINISFLGAKGCQDAPGAAGSEIGCAQYDCMVPWNPSADSVYGGNFDHPAYNRNRQGWDLPNRGGGVTFQPDSENWNFDYSSYLSLTDPEYCSDWGGTEVPWFWGDRYTTCDFKTFVDEPGWTCNCTRPEHPPKDHTPCLCPGEGGADVPLPVSITSCLTEACYTYLGSYYRLFNRDTVWANTFKISPEVSNVTIESCSARVNCQETANHLAWAWGDLGVTDRELICNDMASDLVCGGCFYQGPPFGGRCMDCVDGSATPPVEIIECNDYQDQQTCSGNGCGFVGGCFWDTHTGTGSCEKCPPGGSVSGCRKYGSFDICERDSCEFKECGWDMITQTCQPHGWGDLNCTQMCGNIGDECDIRECKLASIVTKEGCTYETWEPGAPGSVDDNCLSCDRFQGGKCGWYATQGSCKDDLCNFGCWWWYANDGHEECRTCSLAMSSGCSIYNKPENCLKNPCRIDGGCGMNVADKCISCNFIDTCKDYGQQTCFENPCGITGGCGWDPRPGDGECKPAGSLSGPDNYCYKVKDGGSSPPIKECLRDVSNLVENGCWAGLISGSWGCDNCDGSSGYPVKSCQDYSSGYNTSKLSDGGKGGCMRDDCNVGPCVWVDDAIGERCIPALNAEPGEGFGWIRSGGTSGDVPQDRGGNLGGGDFTVHVGGGANIPNQSEAEGFNYSERYFRNGSIWSEVKEMDTLHVLLDYKSEEATHARATDGADIVPTCGWDNLMACDISTLRCGSWTVNSLSEFNFGDYWWPMRRRVPVSNPTISNPPPPQVCGKLCAKKVIMWPRYFADSAHDQQINNEADKYWNMIRGGFLNLTVNETEIGTGSNEMTLQSGWTMDPTRDPPFSYRGNILPPPSHPYTQLNWFNMPVTDAWSLKDTTQNISITGNLTYNMTLVRKPLAMQCLWDSCLHNTGWATGGTCADATDDLDRWLMDEFQCDGTCPCSTKDGNEYYMQNQVNSPDMDPYSCSFPWYDGWLQCMQYTQRYDEDGNPSECKCASWNGTDWEWNLIWQFRCVACWTHDKCDYPLVNESNGLFLETWNDTSSVWVFPYGENFSISRPLTGDHPTDDLKIDMSGYIDKHGLYNITGHIKFKAEPDILNGFDIIFPERYEMIYNAKSYPVEHELYRTLKTWERDECIHRDTSGGGMLAGTYPGDESLVWCPESDGTPDYLECIDYPAYRYLKPKNTKEYESQLVWCIDNQTKVFFGMLQEFRQPENAFLQLTNNPVKKYYHINDKYMALDKNYSLELPIYGIDAGWLKFDWSWVDPSLSLGVARNFHEDEETYYDVAAFYPRFKPPSRQYGTLYRNYTVTEVYGRKISKYADVSGFVKYDGINGIYHVYFTSKTLPVDSVRTATVRFFTHLRSFETPLIGPGPGSVVTNRIGERDPAEILISIAGTMEAYTDATISAMLLPTPSLDPEPTIYISIGPPYNKHIAIPDGGSYTLRLENSKAVVKALYNGYWDDTANSGTKIAKAEEIIFPQYTLNPLIQTRVFLLLVIGFAVIVSYRFFMSKRMDYYTMMQESGLYEMFKDFFGFK